MTLSEVTRNLFERFEMGVCPHDFDKEEAKRQIRHSETSYGTIHEEFRMAMGARDLQSANDVCWWSDCMAISCGMFNQIEVAFYDDCAYIHFIEVGAKAHGWFFVFFETLKRACKAHGVKKITLCDRTTLGFWEAQGFTGHRDHMVLEI